MVNRTATYFAFDGLGETNPAKSDYRYYSLAKGWAESVNIEFKFTNSHEKANAVRDTSKLETLKSSIMQRLRASKNIVIILSDQTRKNGSLLSFEIEKAVDTYNLPLIIAHTNYSSILNPNELALQSRWPDTLRSRVNSGRANAVHIPFIQRAISDAIQQNTVNSGNLSGALNYYSRETHISWNQNSRY